MCPLVVVDDDGDLVLAAGSAGASRIRTALTHTLLNALVDGDNMHTAVNRPRFHAVDDELGGPPVVHAEAGYNEQELVALERAGFAVNRWDHLSHYFGGASAVGRAGAGGDQRRGGVGYLL
jgi:gamma-glutamyltranspeptidase/glutathione hydrolase